MDNTYKYQGQSIKFKKSELKQGATKYYIGNFPAISPPNIFDITELEKTSYSGKYNILFDNNGTLQNQDKIIIEAVTNNIKFNNIDNIPIGKYVIEMNAVTFSNVYIEITDDDFAYNPVFIVEADYIPILLKEKK